MTITALKDTEGKLRGFAQLTRDITERKMHEAALHAAESPNITPSLKTAVTQSF